MFHFLEYFCYAEAFTLVLIFKITTFDLHLQLLSSFPFHFSKIFNQFVPGAHWPLFICRLWSGNCKIHHKRIACDRMAADTVLCVLLGYFLLWSGLEWYWVFDMQRIMILKKNCTENIGKF